MSYTPSNLSFTNNWSVEPDLARRIADYNHGSDTKGQIATQSYFPAGLFRYGDLIRVDASDGKAVFIYGRDDSVGANWYTVLASYT